MERLMTTDDDLAWWLHRAPTLEWTFARTYAETAPHSYVVANRTAGMSREDYVRAAHVISTFGQPAKFYTMTSIYLTSPDGRVKWWTMDRDLDDTSLINQATTERLYGVQNAPSTHSGTSTPYDAIATVYDVRDPATAEEARALRGHVAAYIGDLSPAVLDVRCGTGRMLDLGLTTPGRYAGVDASQPMLNMLVRKHPDVAAVYPMAIERAIEDRLFTPGQFEVVTAYGGAQELHPDIVHALAEIASRVLVLKSGSGPLQLVDRSGSDRG
jgi:Methyltransferase domain